MMKQDVEAVEGRLNPEGLPSLAALITVFYPVGLSWPWMWLLFVI